RYTVAQAKRLLRKTTALVAIQQLPPLGHTAPLISMTLGARFTRRVRVSLVLHAPCYYSWDGCAAILYSVGRLRKNRLASSRARATSTGICGVAVALAANVHRSSVPP